ncbi:MBOAT family O-acyltransferase [Aquirufa nivalisilvae]
MAQIGLFSSVVYLLVALSSIFIFRIQAWKSLLISSILTLGIFMPHTLVFLLLGTAITFQIGIKIQTSIYWKGIGIGLLIGFLIVYKLKDSWIDHMDSLNLNFWGNMEIWQIVGLSFFVFNAISYLMDINKKFIKPTDSFFKLMLYLLYFPTLHAGPLHRFTYLKKQFEQAKITEVSFTNGMRAILWGLFKNFVLAQRLNQLLISLNGSEISGWWTLLIGYVFFFYLYFSFSSFVDFFQGISEIFGIRLKDNFHKRVYFSSNRHEFWKGWHITLNEWFRDYFFYWQIKFTFWRTKPYLLLLLTYVLIGLWHGISWQYLLWGLLSGCWIILEKFGKVAEKISLTHISKYVGIFYHLFFCSILALIFIFPNFSQLLDICSNDNYLPLDVLKLHQRNMGILLFMFILVDIMHMNAKSLRIDEYFGTIVTWKRRILYLGLCSFIILFGVFSRGIDNYYLRF